MMLLQIEDLHVEFALQGATLHAVDGVSLRLDEGEVLGIVGESGSGKSVAMLALMGLVGFPGQVRAAALRFAGQDLLTLPARQRRALTGRDVAMIFQDPGASLNPSFTIGFQIGEVLRQHLGLDRRAAAKRSVELLEQVGIPAAASRLNDYPHQLSGGMNQRVMIAMAIACNPRLLIADEPTTALDVTIQAQILELLRTLQRERGMALVLITHNMGVVAEMAQRVAVMYAGQVVEENAAEALFAAPRHPYTAALLAALPDRAAADTRLASIPGTVPGAYDRPAGCLFAPRCARAAAACAQRPALRDDGGAQVRCHFPIAEAM
ncbi:MAG: ABC transporter ATP-binding protein [Piscinibacter sp.]|nr:ABC transporter ATP-binding protein [Piscinibacter sp.]